MPALTFSTFQRRSTELITALRTSPWQATCGIGVEGTEQSWFASYLKNRTIFTCVDGIPSKSSQSRLAYHKAQCLGHFSLCCFWVTCRLLLLVRLPCFQMIYLFMTAPLQSIIQIVFLLSSAKRPYYHSPVVQWVSNNLQSGKISGGWFQGKEEETSYLLCVTIFGTKSVSVCEKVKHFGIQLTTTLSWTPHVDSLLHRVSPKVFILYWGAEPTAAEKTTLYIACTYAGPVCDSCNKADSVRLESFQLSIAWSILRTDRRSTSNISVLESIGWPTLAWMRCSRFKLLLLWKLLHGEPPSLFAKVLPSVECRVVQTLWRRTIQAPLCHTECRLHSFLPSTITSWNSLPVNVTSWSTCSTFLSALDSYLYS